MRLGSWITVVGLGHHALATVATHLETGVRHRGRPWALPLRTRLVVVCTSLRTNLTLRELAALFAISTSQAHRIIADLRAAAHAAGQ